jgi:hypothetical protein
MAVGFNLGFYYQHRLVCADSSHGMHRMLVTALCGHHGTEACVMLLNPCHVQHNLVSLVAAAAWVRPAGDPISAFMRRSVQLRSLSRWSNKVQVSTAFQRGPWVLRQVQRPSALLRLNSPSLLQLLLGLCHLVWTRQRHGAGGSRRVEDANDGILISKL